MQSPYSGYQFNYNEYKKRTNNNLKVPFSILFLIIIFLSAIIVFIKPIKTSNHELYFITANSFSTYSQANTLSQEIKNFEGAGYIHYDKKYHVIINFYHEKKDAENVINNLKPNYSNIDIYTISIKNLKKSSNLTQKQYKSVKNFNNLTILLLKDLSSLSIQYDKNEISFNLLTSKLKNHYNNFEELYNEFLGQFKSNSKHNISREYAYNIKTNLTTLLNLKDKNIKQIFKYSIVDIAINFASFANFYWFFFFINSTNCQIASPIKNKANNFVSTSFFNFTATSAPHRLNTQPTAASNHVDLKSTNLFFIWIIIATIDIGKNATRLTPCACSCS